MPQKKNVKFSFLLFIVLFSFKGYAQSNFNPFELFATYPKSQATKYRSANGAPGPDYWQNRASYKIDASIDTLTNVLSGKVAIEYTNNSPDALSSLWLQLDQNIYLENSRAAFVRGKTADGYTSGFQFKKVSVGKTANLQSAEGADYIISDTRMQIRLKTPMQPGETKYLFFDYSYSIPGLFGGRTNYFASENGNIYEIAQWYPRMCVYDDLYGWNTLPFIGTGEFYCEYGDFDYKVTVPKGMIVVGSGEVVNEEEVYTPTQFQRLQQARNSDKTVLIRTKDEVIAENNAWRRNKSKKKETVTWHFKMSNSRDVAFGASTSYILDAARINLPEGKKALAMSAYPVESYGDSAWSRSTEYMKGTIEHFSQMWSPYPYPVAVNEAGRAGGMEYPGLIFVGMRTRNKTLFWITAHEIGHTWFPMVVGSNERRHGWMDEGMNTFIDVYASDHFNRGEYAPKRDGEYAPKGGNPADEIVPWIADPNSPTMMNRADLVTGKYRHPFAYFKPAFGMILLREEILGEDRFDYAFKKYIENWSYKHPSPDDFFRTMENEAGEDLSYFWRQWFENNWLFDVAVDSVVANQGFSTIHLTNKEKSAYPVTLEVRYADGKVETMKLPVEVWFNGAHYSLRVHHSSPVQSVTLDPQKKLPDNNRENNTWRR